MKKFIGLLLSFTMLLSLAAVSVCADDAEASSASGEVVEIEDTYNWTVSSGLAVDSSWDKGLIRFAELLDERSGGKIKLTVYSGGTLGSAKETLEGVQMGSIDFIVESSASLSNFTDAMAVFDLPYLFKDSQEARSALSGEAARGQLDALEAVGYHGINYWENGIYAIGSVKEFDSLEGFKGLRCRSIDSPLQADVYKALGAMPVVLTWGDIYTSLQQGVIDCVSSTTVPNMYTANFYEVAPYIIRSNHGYSPAPLLCNLNMWNSLPENVQQLVTECAEEARDYHYTVCDEQLEDFQKKMEEAGVTFIDVDTDEWAAAVEPIYDQYVGEGGVSADLVAAIQADIAAD